jgi:hypothetical protein
MLFYSLVHGTIDTLLFQIELNMVSSSFSPNIGRWLLLVYMSESPKKESYIDV